MSTPERARDHIDAAREYLADEQPTIQQLAKASLILKTWETAAALMPEGHGRDTARSLTAAGYLAASWISLERSLAHSDLSQHEVDWLLSTTRYRTLLELGRAEHHLGSWGAETAPAEARDEPESARDRVGGKLRSAQIYRACKCLDHIEIADCSDAVWRETLAREAGKSCARHAVEWEREWLTKEQRAAECARTLETLTDEWEVQR